jgi:hypothetical protein
MATTASSPPPAASGDGVDRQPRPRSTRKVLARAAIVVIVLGSALLWIYALSGVAREDPPNTLEDQAFAAAAEPLCAAALTDLRALPRAEQTPSPTERADVLDRSNAILRAMVTSLRDEAPEPGTVSDRDLSMIDEWLADWDVYVADRADFAQRLRSDEMARFYVTEKVKGLQITKAIDDLAEVNDMPSCATPGDLG